MHKLALYTFTLVAFGLASARCFANPIIPCQHLLTEAKDRLAQMELEKFARLRSNESLLQRHLRGLLVALYEADLDEEYLPLGEAFSYVPAVPRTASKYIDQAQAEGLLILEDDPNNRNFRRLRPGPRLRDVIKDDLDLTLARLFDDASHLPLSTEVALGSPPVKRSAALDRMLLRKIWFDYDRVWQPLAPEHEVHLRHTYGLLVHLYQSNLRDHAVTKRSAHQHVPLFNQESRARALSSARRQGLIEVRRSKSESPDDFVHATPRTIDYVEGRIKAGLDRTNAILRKALAERP